jgi:uncharacterized protein
MNTDHSTSRGGVLSCLVLTALAATSLGQAAGGATSPDRLLLKDFRPVSIFKVPQTRIEKARYPVVDMHSHAYAKTDTDVDRWVQTLDAVGVARAVILTGATGKGFDDLVARFKRYPGRFEMWCGIDLSGCDKPGFGPGAIAELERCRTMGAKGVGELIDKGGGLGRNAGGMHIDDPRMDAILERCADLGLPLNVHVGEDRWMYEPMDGTNDGLMNAFQWKVSSGPGILSHDEVVATLEQAVKKHPRTTFVACHFANCCSDLARLAAMLDQYPNLYADISARYAETSPIPRFMGRFYERYQGRLLYGTDMGTDPEMYRTTFRMLETEDEHFYDWNLFTYHWPLYGLGLKDEVLKKVYAENAGQIMKGVKSPL